jgi:hypothetical protein
MLRKYSCKEKFKREIAILVKVTNRARFCKEDEGNWKQNYALVSIQAGELSHL